MTDLNEFRRYKLKFAFELKTFRIVVAEKCNRRALAKEKSYRLEAVRDRDIKRIDLLKRGFRALCNFAFRYQRCDLTF